MQKKTITNALYEVVSIDTMSYGEYAIGKLSDGRVIFIPEACPGDVVEVEITQEKKHHCYGRIHNVVTPSPLRSNQAHDEITCDWAHIDYRAQLQFKRNIIVNQLIRIGGIDEQRAHDIVAETVPSKYEWGYRNKVEFSCNYNTQHGFQLGFHKPGGNFYPTTNTLLLPQKIQKIPAAIQGALRYIHGNSDLGIHRIQIRYSQHTKHLEIALWTTPGLFPRAQVADVLTQATKAHSIVRIITKDTSSARAVKKVEVLAGKGYWKERLFGFIHKVSAPSFFQVNSLQAENLIQITLDYMNASTDDIVADLYCGLGTFTLPVAQQCAGVYAVERAGSSVRDLRRSAQGSFTNVEIIGGDAAREIQELNDIDIVLVDPPRQGLDASMPSTISKTGAKKIVYVSCDPATLARDIKRLEEKGFILQAVTPVDMFPQTHHVETVVLMSRKDT